MFMQIVSVGDVVGNSGELGDSRMFSAKAEVFVW